MKRLYRRLAIVGVVMVVGAIAIAQAQLMGKKESADQNTTEVGLSGGQSGSEPIRPIGANNDFKPLVAPTTSLSMPRSTVEPPRDMSPATDSVVGDSNPTGYSTSPRYSVGDDSNTHVAANGYGSAPTYENPTETGAASPAARGGLYDDPNTSLGQGSESRYNTANNGNYESPNYAASDVANYDAGARNLYAPPADESTAERPQEALSRTSGPPPAEPRTLADVSYQPLGTVQPTGATEEATPTTGRAPAGPGYGAYGPAPPEVDSEAGQSSLRAQALAANPTAATPASPASAPNANVAAPYGSGGNGYGALGSSAGIVGTAAPRAPASYNEAYAGQTPAPAAPSNGVAVATGIGDATSDSPGARQFDGAQSPSITIEKRAPAEIQVGKPAIFETTVRNVGQVDAANVMVVDQIPRGVQFVESTPQPSQTPDGGLLWQLGTLAPGESKKITLQLMPQQEGEIGSVAQVLFSAQASVRTICTKPELTVEHTAPQRVLIGERVQFAITIANPGTGAATGVIIQEDVPAGLRHPAGSELEYEIGSLRPQESKRLELTLIADKPGIVRNVLRVRGDGGLESQHEVNIEVIAPNLQVAMAGPTRRYLERQAQYSVSVSNPGTAPANNIQLVTHLPKGMKFVTTDHEGQYDPKTHAVYWGLEELPAGETGVVQLTMLPIEAGDQELRVEGKADLGLSHAIAKAVQVDGLAELTFSVADVASPIEVGSETTYIVRVQNNGSKQDTNVQVAAEFPAGLRPISGDGPTRAVVQGQVVIFEPLGQLAPKGESVFKITAKGAAAGDQLVRVQVQSDEIATPVTKEEHTRVYQDE